MIKAIIRQFKKRNFRYLLLKIIEVMFGYPLLALSFAMKRDKNKIVIGSHTPFNDNSKYFFILGTNQFPNKRQVWIARSLEIAKRINDMGFESYYRWSLQGVWHSLTAGVYVYSFHILDVNLWTWGGAFRVNLYHGIPLKHIEFSAKSGSSVDIYNENSWLARIFVLYIFIRPHIFLTTSEDVSNYCNGAFRLGENTRTVLATLPRCEVLKMDRSALREFISSYEEPYTSALISKIEKFKKTFIYMPTWRDYEFFIDSGFNFQQLNDELLKNDSIFLIKLHPSSVIDIDLSVYPALDVLPASLDIYPILPYTDVLVTDYSSIYYDYLILNKPIILFPFDREKYIEKDRGFIEDYFTAMPSPYFDTFEELLDGMFQELDVDDDKIMQIKRRKCGSVSSTAIPQIFDALP